MELSDSQRETFAQFRAAGLSLTEAAKRAGYAEGAAANTGSRLAQVPAIAKRIEELQKIDGHVVGPGARSPASRVTAIENRWVAMRTLIAERAAEPEMQTIAGGKTGLLTVSFKSLGSGQNTTIVKEYKVDTGLLYELRMHEELISEELGQKVKRSEQLTNRLNVNLDGKDLNRVLRDQLGLLTEEERKTVMLAVPSLAECIEDTPECGKLDTPRNAVPQAVIDVDPVEGE